MTEYIHDNTETGVNAWYLSIARLDVVKKEPLTHIKDFHYVLSTYCDNIIYKTM